MHQKKRMPTCATYKEQIHNAFSRLCFKYHPTEIRGRSSKQYCFCFKYECIRENNIGIEAPILWPKKWEDVEMIEFAQMIKKCEQAHPYKKWNPGA
jgi:hypothetical protein